MKHPHLLARILFVLLFNAIAAYGATITVFSNADSGAGTLRQAIFDASSGDTINFAIQFQFPSSPREIQVSSELLMNKNLTIKGPTGADKLTVRAANNSFSSFRVLRIAPASVTVTISGLTFSGAESYSFPPGPGGGIVNTGTLILDNCAISGSSAQEDGGGVASTGVLTIGNSTISGNISVSGQTSYGGGITNTGVLTVSNSTISGNSFSTGFGGGTPTFNGGGIANLSGATLTITNSTVAGNGSNVTALHLGCVKDLVTIVLQPLDERFVEVFVGNEFHATAPVKRIDYICPQGPGAKLHRGQDRLTRQARVFGDDLIDGLSCA
jgi:hypothetical protein